MASKHHPVVRLNAARTSRVREQLVSHHADFAYGTFKLVA